jgi:ion channel-forming bestrophin family protein
MIVKRRIPWRWTLYYTWPSLFYFLILSTAVFAARRALRADFQLSIPFEPVAVIGTALGVFLAFQNNNAYDRWWEARKIWGSLVNLSRAWARQILTITHTRDTRDELRMLQQRMIYRHLAFVNALRVHLRGGNSIASVNQSELIEVENNIEDALRFLPDHEAEATRHAANPPNVLLQRQGEDLRRARDEGWISEWGLMQLDQTLTELNHVQGSCERIKNTASPRFYTYFQSVIVHIHGSLLPFAFATDVDWAVIPLTLTVNFVFLALNMIGTRTEDPFENRLDDTPMSSLSRTIEINLREQLGETQLPKAIVAKDGVLF